MTMKRDVEVGALRGIPVERVMEKPTALKSGGDFPLIKWIYPKNTKYSDSYLKAW